MVGKKVKVVLSYADEGIDSQGSPTFYWKDICQLEGTLQSNSGREQFIEGSWKINADFIFYTKKLRSHEINEKNKLRIPIQNREFDIVRVENILEQGTFLKISLLERH